MLFEFSQLEASKMFEKLLNCSLHWRTFLRKQQNKEKHKRKDIFASLQCKVVTEKCSTMRRLSRRWGVLFPLPHSITTSQSRRLKQFTKIERWYKGIDNAYKCIKTGVRCLWSEIKPINFSWVLNGLVRKLCETQPLTTSFWYFDLKCPNYYLYYTSRYR